MRSSDDDNTSRLAIRILLANDTFRNLNLKANTSRLKEEVASLAGGAWEVAESVALVIWPDGIPDDDMDVIIELAGIAATLKANG
jgi:RNA-binding protein YlmH